VKLFSTIRKDAYQVINVTFLIIILFVFLYSALFSPKENNYPIKSSYYYYTGKQSISGGLSHGFSSVMRGKLHEAAAYNPYSIQLFSFFVIQFFMRLIVLVYLLRVNECERGVAIKTDIIISIALFFLFFYPFLKDLF